MTRLPIAIRQPVIATLCTVATLLCMELRVRFAIAARTSARTVPGGVSRRAMLVIGLRMRVI